MSSTVVFNSQLYVNPDSIQHAILDAPSIQKELSVHCNTGRPCCREFSNHLMLSCNQPFPTNYTLTATTPPCATIFDLASRCKTEQPSLSEASPRTVCEHASRLLGMESFVYMARHGPVNSSGGNLTELEHTSDLEGPRGLYKRTARST